MSGITEGEDLKTLQSVFKACVCVCVLLLFFRFVFPKFLRISIWD